MSSEIIIQRRYVYIYKRKTEIEMGHYRETQSCHLQKERNKLVNMIGMRTACSLFQVMELAREFREKKKNTGKLPEPATKMLLQWFETHKDMPMGH